MGVGLRRVTEKVRQAAGMSGRNFQPTSNLRNATMMKEATDFAAHLNKCESAIAKMKAAGETILNTTKLTMSAPLPHIFEDTATGSGGDVRPNLSIGGPSFEPETVSSLCQSASAQLESQVLVPIKRWLDVFAALQIRMKEVEALRLEVDSRRHTVIDLAASVDKLRAKLSKASGSDGKLEASLDDTIKKLQHKEGKLSLTVQSFQEKEQALSSDLSTLIKDAAWLRHYMSSALRVQGEALLGAATALGDTTRPDASISMSSLSLGSHGNSSQGGTVGGAPSAMGGDSRGATPAGVPSGGGGGNGASSMMDGASNPFLASGVIQN